MWLSTVLEGLRLSAGKKRRFAVLTNEEGRPKLHLLYKETDSLEQSTTIPLSTVVSIEPKVNEGEATPTGFVIRYLAVDG